MPNQLVFDIVTGDITAFEADVIALKYAQAFHGADKAVAERLQRCGRSTDALAQELRNGDHALVTIAGCVAAPNVLFLRVPRLAEFRYAEIGNFASSVLQRLTSLAPDVTHVAMTIHGVGYGLDEAAAIQAQYGGCIRALESGAIPARLQRISIVEINPERVRRLRRAIEQQGRATRLALAWQEEDTGVGVERGRQVSASNVIDSAGGVSDGQPHVFVAMPFETKMLDIYHYGIEGPVHDAGYLSERIDQALFTGGIAETIFSRIQSAELVIADLSGANANVYLEVGFAWGRNRPTILLVNDAKDLKFDVAHMRCIIYDSIRSLEEKLRKELLTYQQRRPKAVVKVSP